MQKNGFIESTRGENCGYAWKNNKCCHVVESALDDCSARSLSFPPDSLVSMCQDLRVLLLFDCSSSPLLGQLCLSSLHASALHHFKHKWDFAELELKFFAYLPLLNAVTCIHVTCNILPHLGGRTPSLLPLQQICWTEVRWANSRTDRPLMLAMFSTLRMP